MALEHHFIFDTTSFISGTLSGGVYINSINSGKNLLTSDGSDKSYADGKINQALNYGGFNLSGTAYNSSKMFPSSGGATIAYWLYTNQNEIGGGDDIHPLFHVRNGSQGTGEFYIKYYSSGSFGGYVEISDSSTGSLTFPAIGSGVNYWNHHIISTDGTNWYAYVNNEMQSINGTTFLPTFYDNGDFIIDYGTDSFTYALDDLRIYYENINLSERSFIYNNGEGTQANSNGGGNMANEFIVRNGLVVISGKISGTLANNIVFSGNINSGQVGFYHLASGVISTATLGSGQVTSGVIASGSVGQFALSSGAVNSGHIGNGAVVSGSIASGSVGQYAIASGSITAEHIASGAIINADIADNAVTSGKIASGTIGSLHISSGGVINVNLGDASVNTRVLASGSVNNTILSSGAVVSGQIGNGAVVSGSIASGSISKFHIASGQIVKALTQGTNISITADANDNYTITATVSGGVATEPLIVSSGLSFSSGSFYNGTQSGAIIGIKSGGIVSQMIADNAIVSGKVASGSIGIYQLASGVISTATLGSGQVTSGIIGNNAVVSGSIASGQVGQFHLASGVVNSFFTSGFVTSGMIGNGAVVSGSIASGQVGQFQHASGSVTSGHIGNAAVVSGSIASGIIGSIHLADGAVLSGDISSGQIGLYHLASGTVLSGTFVVSGSVQSGSIGNAAVVSGSIASGVIGSVHLADGAVLSGDISSGQIGQYHMSSGTLFSVTNPVDNRVLTSLASGTNQANAEANFTFDGSNLNVGLISGLTTFAVTSGGYVKIQSSLYSGQNATFDAYRIPQADGVAAFYDYYVYNSTNGSYRAGNVVSTWNTLSGIIVYSETGTDDLGGSTIDLQWSTILQSGNVVLRSTLTAGTWNVKVGARVL